jgi:hypothetical protein
MMNDGFKKLLLKKKEKSGEMSEGRQKARGSVLDDLMGNMDSRDGQKLGMKKVSVMAPSEDGLKEGLEKAKEVVDGKLPEGSEAEELGESHDEEEQEQPMEHKSPEELMEEIERLKAELAMKG